MVNLKTLPFLDQLCTQLIYPRETCCVNEIAGSGLLVKGCDAVLFGRF